MVDLAGIEEVLAANDRTPPLQPLLAPCFLITRVPRVFYGRPRNSLKNRWKIVDRPMTDDRDRLSPKRSREEFDRGTARNVETRFNRDFRKTRCTSAGRDVLRF